MTTAPNATTTATTTAADQSAALRTMLTLTEQHPTLPAAYTVITPGFPDEVDVQLAGPSDLEAWRIALDVAPEYVRLRIQPDRCWLHFTAHLNGVTLKAYTTFTPAACPAEVPGSAA